MSVNDGPYPATGAGFKPLSVRRPTVAARLRQYGILAWPLFSGLIGFGALFVLWLIASYLLPPHVVPAPADTLAAFFDLVRKGILPAYVLDSIWHLLVPSLIAIAVGLPLGIAIALNRWVASFFFPLLNFFQALGGIVWIPLFILWFGMNETTIVATVFYTVIFPITFNTLIGVRSIPPVFLHASATLGASRWQQIRDVVVPGALPNIITGIRLGFAYGWRALVAAEILVGANGLGFMIFDAQTFSNLPRLVLGMIVIGMLWLAIDRLFLQPVEARTIERWNMVRS